MVQCELAFGRFRLQPGRQLLSDGEPVTLGAKPLNILSALVEARGGLVTKDELIEQVWPGLVVEENTLQAHISAIRKVLGDDGRWIATVPGRGYRFAGPLAVAHDSGDTAGPSGPITATETTSRPATPAKSRRAWPIIAIGVGLMLAAAAGWGIWRRTESPRRPAVRPERYLILPFVNRTGDPHQDEFADALTDAVAARIAAQSWDSEVVGHNMAFAYKGKPINDEKLTEQLDLTFIIEGSLLPSENGVQSTATIVDARTGTQIATVTAQAPKDSAETERKWLAVGLAEQARWNIFRQEERLVAAGKPDDQDIRNLLIRAESALDEQSLSSWDVAAPLIDKALAIDPHNVHALCVYSQLRIQFVTAFDFKDEADRTRMLNESDAALTEAARIDPTRTTVHLMLGDLRSAQGRHEAARAEYQRVLELDPLNASGLDAVAMEDIYFGQPDAALPKLEQARLINPEDAYLIDGDIAIMRVTLGQDAEALAAIRKAVTVDSSDPWVWMYLAALLQLNGQHEEAQSALSTLRRLNPTVTIAKLRLADLNASPQYQKSQERLYAALSQLGLPEGSPK